MRVGDKVRVVAGGGQEDFFDDGCVGSLTEPSGERGWWVDFNHPENAPGTFCQDCGGIWAVSEHNLVLVSDALTNLEVAQLQARVGELEAALATQDRILRSSVPERWKGCTSPVGSAQSYIAELEQALLRVRQEAVADDQDDWYRAAGEAIEP